jgi:malic enzyme
LTIDAQELPVALRGHDLIREPLLNKGSAFTAEERAAFGLDGLLPARTLTIDQQRARVHRKLSTYAEPLQKFVFLASLQDRNEHLYFNLLTHHLEELLPIVYTPTVGLATRQFSHVFQRARGVWVTPGLKGRIAEVLRRAACGRDIRLLVATDNESILGIGDQGAGGIAISIGKLALYTAGAGIDPATVLPVSLDVGTDNETLLADPLYLGWQQRRLRGKDYDALLEEFVTAVAETFPHALVQWEDFRKDNALRVLERYVDRLPSFNDDIQGTGAMALAALLGAGRLHGRPLTGERIIVLGAGAAGLGITRQIRVALGAAGQDEATLRRQIAVLDSRGLIVDDGRLADPYKRELAWQVEDTEAAGLGGDRGFAAVVDAFRPTVLIGTSGQRGAFSEAIVRAVLRGVERPVILPL